MSDARSDGREKRRKPASRASSSKFDIDYLLNSRPPTSAHAGSSRSGQSSRAHSGATSSAPIHIHHETSKRKSKDRPYECEVCGFSFSQRSDRNKHIRTVHLGERPFTCSYCSQSFGEKGNLYVILLMHLRRKHTFLQLGLEKITV